MNDSSHILKKQFHLPYSRNLARIVRSFSASTRLLFFIFVALFVGSGLYLAYKVNGHYLEDVPIAGGTLVEGIVGLPRFINPVLAVTDAGKDVTHLVYSGLMRENVDGTLSPDLAESYEVSEDGRTYTFKLKENLVFHDGKPLTTDDIEYTIQKAVDPALKSPQRAAWSGVQISKIDSRTISFTLPRSYNGFLEDATLGILPKHIWGNVVGDEFTFSSYNENAIGSGPYKITKIEHNEGGIPTAYTLQSFSDYASGQPLIDKIIIKFYNNERVLVEGYNAGEVDSMGPISPENAKFLSTNSNTRIERSTLPRVFGIFFNQNQQPLFIHTEVKQALDEAIDKQALVNTIFQGFSEPLAGPLPPGVAPVAGSTTPAVDEETHITNAKQILEKAGWVLNNGVYELTTSKGTERLSFSLSTADAPELTATAEYIKNEWQKVGAEVTIKIFSTGDLNQNVIQPRYYDTLLFGQIVTDERDLYAFWHSSQRNNPGLNIALYTNGKADKVLEDLQKATSTDVIAKDYEAFQTELTKDKAAIFLFSPQFLYVVPQELKGFALGKLKDPDDRWNGVSTWYMETDSVWKIFLGKNN